MAKAVRSPRRCRVSCLKPAASPPTSFTACTAAAAPAPAKVSGNTAASSRASRRRTSTGAARRATIISMSASRNGRPRTPCGCGPTARPRWPLPRKQARDSKLERGLIVTFALAELLVAGGERVGIPGLMNPTSSRNVIDKMAQAMLHDDADAREPAAVLRAVGAGRDRGAVGLLVADARDQDHARRPVGVRRAWHADPGRRSRRRDLPLFRPRRIRRTGERRASSPPAAPRAGPATMSRASRCIATRSAARPTSSTGCSRPTPPAARRPSCCCSCTRGMMVSKGAARASTVKAGRSA